MGKRLLLISILVSLLITVTACSLNGGEDDEALGESRNSTSIELEDNVGNGVEDDVVHDEENNEPNSNGDNNVDNNESNNPSGEMEKSEYEKALEEVIGDDVLDEDEMINIARDLIAKLYFMSTIPEKEQFDKMLNEIITGEQLKMNIAECCFASDVEYGEVTVDFSDEFVLQTGKDKFEYGAIIYRDYENYDEIVSEYFLLIANKEDDVFKISDFFIDDNID